jgi:hypothetical protein
MQRVHVQFAVNGTIKSDTFTSDRISIQIDGQTGIVTLFDDKGKEVDIKIYSQVYTMERWPDHEV